VSRHQIVELRSQSNGSIPLAVAYTDRLGVVQLERIIAVGRRRAHEHQQQRSCSRFC